MSPLSWMLGLALVLLDPDEVKLEAPVIASVWEAAKEQSSRPLPEVIYVARVPLKVQVLGLELKDEVKIYLDDNQRPDLLNGMKKHEKEGVVLQLRGLPAKKPIVSQELKISYTRGKQPSKASNAVKIKVVYPAPPGILGVSDEAGEDFRPLNEARKFTVRNNKVWLKIDEPGGGDVKARIGGRVLPGVTPKQGVITIDCSTWHPAVYQLTVSVVDEGYESDDSTPVWIDYAPSRIPAVPKKKPKKEEMPDTTRGHRPEEQIEAALPPPPAPPRAIPVHFRKRTDESFNLLPLVQEVPAPKQGEGAYPDGTTPSPRLPPSLAFEAFLRGLPLYDARFDAPAHFPLPQFGLLGERLDGDGAMIYEGMHFVATPDGQYEVSFTVSVPSMPVTLRIQLFVTDPRGRTFSLTLPPVALAPDPNFAGNYVGRSFQVRHAGHSRLIALAFPGLCDCTLSRQGTARFGSWPDGINTFGLFRPSIVVTTDTATAPIAAPPSDTTMGGTAP
ncbi:MAG: hypothetical protein HYS12_00730 [Planctomycetes bacterium]|nr:hypothetical protein [Planctomycetota bacterium]